MNNLRKLLFLLMLLIYSSGVLIGAVREIHAQNQSEMYEYLKDGINAYDTASASGVKSAAKENVKILALLAIGSLAGPLAWIVGVAMFIKGYTGGFSVMAVLRLYGIKGSLLCISSLFSAAILIPAASYYGALNARGLLLKEEKRSYYKKMFVSTIFLGAIFCADALIKGAASPIFIKWASRFLISG
ncbi:MAG: hypothetical protein K5664_05645 [Firmicutes bacterium]|nr:hypothetical protein [Bacillota bacterium]